MAPVKSADRIKAEDMRQIIEKALEPGDYEHDTAWIDGHPAEVDTPPQHLVNLAILTAGLPEPDPADGTVDISEAAAAVLSVIEQRLAPFPYSNRYHSLRRRLIEQAELWDQAHGLDGTGVPDAIPDSVLRCMVCSKPLPAGSRASRRTCSDACRQKLSRIRNASVTDAVTP